MRYRQIMTGSPRESKHFDDTMDYLAGEYVALRPKWRELEKRLPHGSITRANAIYGVPIKTIKNWWYALDTDAKLERMELQAQAREACRVKASTTMLAAVDLLCQRITDPAMSKKLTNNDINQSISTLRAVADGDRLPSDMLEKIEYITDGKPVQVKAGKPPKMPELEYDDLPEDLPGLH